MKKGFLVAVILFIAASFTTSATAQTKIGYFDDQSVIALFPGIQEKLDTVLRSYAQDTLQEEYNYTLKDYQIKDSIFRRDSAELSKKAKAYEMATTDLNKLKYKLINWQQYQQEAMQQKQEQLLLPFRQKIFAALSEVISENKKETIIETEVKIEDKSVAIPDGVEVITMPRLSDTMEEGTVAKWLFKVGEKITEGDILAEIETDKATMEFESFNEGTLLYVGVQEGETAPVDVLLAIIGDAGEDISEFINGNSNAEAISENKKEVIIEPEVNVENKSLTVPDGVEVITMPRLSDTMEEGTVATWNKKIGDLVEEGDILAEIETDKATMEFESFYTGVLLEVGVKEGETAKVDAVLAVIGPKGTNVAGILDHYSTGGKKVVKENPVKKEIPAVVETKVETPKREIPVLPKDNVRVFVSPLAKKLAEEKGISLSQLTGSGENGRIIKRDIENYQPVVAGNSAYTPVGEESFEEVKNSQMRKVIAKRLGESKFMAPHYYLTVELDMDNAIAARTAINSDPDVKVSYNDMVVKASAMALRKHPKVNSHWTDTATLIAKHIHQYFL